MEMRSGLFWTLVCSAGLLSARVASASQSSTGNTTQSSKTSTSSPTPGKTNTGVKVTVMKSRAVPWAKKTEEDTTSLGASSPKPAPPAAASKSTAASQAPASTPSKLKTPAKPKAARPTPPAPPGAPTLSAEHKPDTASQAPHAASEGVITVKGSVAGIDMKTVPPTVQVKLSFGPEWTMTLDPATASIVNGDYVGTLDDVHVHDEVTVAYAPKNGQRLVKSLEITTVSSQPPAPSAGTAASPKTSQ